MKNTRHMRALASILLIFFLFTAIVLRSLSAFNPPQGTLKTLVSQKEDPSSKADTQLIFDVKESEERSENGCGSRGAEDLQNNFYLIGQVSTSALFTISESRHYSLYYTPHSFGNATGVPLYLAQRSFLI